MQAPVKGIERFLREQSFLDNLAARKLGPRQPDRSLRDSIDPNFYMPDDDQLNAYSAFRHKMDAEFGKPD